MLWKQLAVKIQNDKKKNKKQTKDTILWNLKGNTVGLKRRLMKEYGGKEVREECREEEGKERM